MDHLGAQYIGPSQQNQSIKITLRYESGSQTFNIEIEQSIQVQELIQEIRGQLNIPERKLIILKQGSNRLVENRLLSSYGFPKEVVIDVITEDANQTAFKQQAEKEQSLLKQQAQQQPTQQSNVSTKQNSAIVDKEIMLVIKVPTLNKIFNVQMPESTKIEDLIDQLKKQSVLQVERWDELQITHRGFVLDYQKSLRDHDIQKGAEIIISIKTNGG